MARRDRYDDGDHSEVDDLGALIAGDIAEQNEPWTERRPGKPRNHILLIISAVLALAIGAVAVLFVRDLLDSAEPVADYSGEGTAAVNVRVEQGDTLSDIAVTLHEAGVVQSVEAFTEAAMDNEQATGIQPGLYALRQEMKASLAIDAMLNPANRLTKDVTVPEGLTVAETLAALSSGTGIAVADLEAALADRANLGLPAWYPADAPNLEGVLQPGTYEFDVETTPLQVIQTLVQNFAAVTTELGIEQGAAALGQTPYGIVIIASLIEEEAKWDDERAKVARVVYNRLAEPMPLQIDAATAYGAGKPGNELTIDDLESTANPYNLRVLPGLPPTPIAGTGKASLQAALNPESGPWLYYVVNSSDGHHLFTDSYNEFLAGQKACQDNNWGC